MQFEVYYNCLSVHRVSDPALYNIS
jgi:hypothetical protein